jgi:predicted transcriptional regulator
MSEETPELGSNFTELTGEIVAAYVSNNSVPVAELPNLIRSVHNAVAELALDVPSSTAVSVPLAEKPSPAEVRKSIRPDGIVSFIDGKTYKTLKRHLTAHGLDPRGYRERFGLPTDYPMVTANYAAQRSALAKAIGLGRPGAMAEAEAKDRREAA